MKKKKNKIVKNNLERVGIFVDGANIYYSMKDIRMDFKDLKTWVAEGRNVRVCVYVNSMPDDKKISNPILQFFKRVKECGFDLELGTLTRNKETGKIKQEGVDLLLAVKAMHYRDLFDRIIIVSGDYDYLPLIRQMKEYNKEVEIIAFKDCLHHIYHNKDVRIRYMEDFMNKNDPLYVQIEVKREEKIVKEADKKDKEEVQNYFFDEEGEFNEWGDY